MAKSAYVELQCDYCRNKASFPADRPLTPGEKQESDRWVLVAFNDGQQEHYCSAFHAGVALKQRSEVKLTDGE